MHVLGVINPATTGGAPSDGSLLQLHTEPRSALPRVLSAKEFDIAVQFILYQKPSPTRMQYVSLSPISLALADKTTELPRHGQIAIGSKWPLVQKLRCHTVMKRIPTQKELFLPTVLNQINCSMQLTELMAKNASLIGPRLKRKLSVGERVVESASTAWDYFTLAVWHILIEWVYPIITRSFIYGLIGHRIVAELILQILEWRFRNESTALKDISATAQQIDIRLQQFCYWPIQYTTLRRRRDDWESVTDRHADYIRFYNSLWLVANDVIIGIALGSYIIDNADLVAVEINHILTHWTVNGLQAMIVWLTDWPAGLKLNNELASFLGDLILWVIEYWSRMKPET